MVNEISLMFSGGIDSTYVAIKLAEKYKKIYLLNYSNGYGHTKFNRVNARVKELEKLYPEKFVLFQTSIKDTFENILINNLRKETDMFGSAFIWCLSCKLSMHARSIIFNKKNKIKIISDGSSYDTQYMVEQTPFAINIIKKLYNEFNQEYIFPSYNISREKKRKELTQKKLRRGFKLFDRHIGIQPKCYPGELSYSPLVILGKQPHYKEEDIINYIELKLPIIKSYILSELE